MAAAACFLQSMGTAAKTSRGIPLVCPASIYLHLLTRINHEELVILDPQTAHKTGPLPREVPDEKNLRTGFRGSQVGFGDLDQTWISTWTPQKLNGAHVLGGGGDCGGRSVRVSFFFGRTTLPEPLRATRIKPSPSDLRSGTLCLK